ncbi:asparagine synthetase B [Mucilaginibacter myungsuensis]|uniref:Asparagine synthetase B n=1 Tax=Mucilaginibacter myungsuensis TaxID=649104 RepID=A0A929KUH2_9SPHI|nr:asparagine synthetase B [Mucilaginibacter myungsuensis]MBE9661794.1 asparagine synthetase B [Mucilaginibacter myungsuensis]MDN3599772.1 asparagine synthetase B [Mucilaginibacter myungsuensis]
MTLYKRILLTLIIILTSAMAKATGILLPMDESQKDHLKAYGIAFWSLQRTEEVNWLLNYRGGSFLLKYSKAFEDECKIRGISYEVIADAQVNQIMTEVADPSVNMDVVKLEKAPKMAVYAPKSILPWDDAVTMVLKYAEIPYDMVYDEEVLKGGLTKYDWLHLHHEDFTGQYSKFYNGFSHTQWYTEDVKTNETLATKMGFSKVSKMKLAVAQHIRDFCTNGGFLFAMCSGTDTFDIALAAANTDICENMFDGDAADPDAQSKLDFSQTFAFQNFTLDRNPMSNRFSNINVTRNMMTMDRTRDFFTLFDFSAKWDVVPSMLTQNHDKVIKGFMGLTTAYNKSILKPGVTIMGEMKSANEARYIHGEYGKGQWTFYGGHDPEDYQHQIGDPPTDLKLHPNSTGYRLILNNVLFPAAKKKKQKT